METVEQVKGWMLSGVNPELYKFHTDDKVFHSGKRSGVLYSTTASANQRQFGTMMQGFQALTIKEALENVMLFKDGRRYKVWCMDAY